MSRLTRYASIFGIIASILICSNVQAKENIYDTKYLDVKTVYKTGISVDKGGKLFLDSINDYPKEGYCRYLDLGSEDGKEKSIGENKKEFTKELVGNTKGKGITISRKVALSKVLYTEDLSKTEGDYSSFKDYQRYTSLVKEFGNIKGADLDTIKKLAKQIVGEETNPYLKAKKVYAYVNTNFKYNKKEGRKGVINTLDTKEGVCEDFAQLFVVLCREVEVPSRLVYGVRLNRDKLRDDFVLSNDYHAWSEFYLPEYGWVIADPTIYYNNSLRIPRDTCWEGFAKDTKGEHLVLGYDKFPDVTVRIKGSCSLGGITEKVYIREIKKSDTDSKSVVVHHNRYGKTEHSYTRIHHKKGNKPEKEHVVTHHHRGNSKDYEYIKIHH